MQKKNDRLISKKLLLILSISILLVLLALFLSPLLKMFIGDIYGFFDFLANSPELWRAFGILALLLVSILLFFCIILPTAIFAVKVVSAYISLYNICLLSDHRITFNGIKRSSADGEITIKTHDGTLCLHFINVIFKFRRAITIPNSQEYVITPLVPKKISKQGQGIGGANMSSGNGNRNALIRSTQYALNKNHDKTKSLPEIEYGDKRKHILLIPNMPSEANCVVNNVVVPLSNGQTIGDFTYYSLSHLKKGLKGKLHTSIF
ncbi:MAG: hypothetical protein IKK01_10140 [Clostridia bacterium]|nr:hypothetical protein [Clostridia bacterium]